MVPLLLVMVADWRALLNSGLGEEELRELGEHSRTGRPLGSKAFVERVEHMVGRVLRPQKAGRPRKLPCLPNISIVSAEFGCSAITVEPAMRRSGRVQDRRKNGFRIIDFGSAKGRCFRRAKGDSNWFAATERASAPASLGRV